MGKRDMGEGGGDVTDLQRWYVVHGPYIPHVPTDIIIPHGKARRDGEADRKDLFRFPRTLAAMSPENKP